MNKLFLLMICVFYSLASLATEDLVTLGSRKKANIISAIKASMDFSLQRQEILSQNIASANVYNYHARDLKKVNFNDPNIYNKKNNVRARTTNIAHISSKKQNLTNINKVIKEPFGEDTKISKNNVNLQEQMVKVAENNADYNLSSTLYKKMTGLIKLSIGR